MREEKIIKEKIIEMARRGLEDVFVAEVTAVNNDTCSIKLGETTVSDVRLRAVVNGEDSKLLITPKVNSKVLVANIGKSDYTEMMVIAYSEVEKIEVVTDSIKITNLKGTLTVEFDGKDKKVDIKNNSVSLKSLMQEIADIISQLKLTTPAGPSGTPLPTTITAVENFKTNFKKLLK